MRKFDYLYLFLIFIIIFNIFYPAEIHPTTAPLLIYAVFLIYLSSRIENVFLYKKTEITIRSLLQSTILTVILLLSSLTGVYFSQSRDYIYIIFAYAMIFAFIHSITLNEKKIWTGINLLLVATGMICLYAILQYTTDFFSLSERLQEMTGLSRQDKEIMTLRLAQKRVYAFFAFPTSLSSFLTMMIPLNIGAIIRKKSVIIRIIFSIILALQVAALFLSKSYGGIITLLGVTLFLICYLLFRRLKINLIKTLMFTTGLIILILLIIFIGNFRSGLFKFEDPSNPITLRLANWNVALKIISDYPLMGAGLGNYGVVFPKYYTSGIQPSQYAHNTYLQILSEAGLFFGIILLIFFTRWFSRLLSKGLRNESAIPSNHILYMALLSAFMAFLINNIFEINAYYPSLGFIGIFIAALLDKTTFQSKKTGEGVLYLNTIPNRIKKLVFREKNAIATLIVTWLLVTMLLSLRFVSLLLYDSAGDKYISYELNTADRYITAAQFFDPMDSRFHYLSSLISFEKYTMFRDKEYIGNALDSANKAVSLNPLTPYLRANFSSMLFYRGKLWKSLYQLNYADFLMPHIRKYRNEVELFTNKILDPRRYAKE